MKYISVNSPVSLKGSGGRGEKVAGEGKKGI